MIETTLGSLAESAPVSDTSWSARAACIGLTEVFFGPAAERPERRVEREAVARTYCQSCPVMEPCRLDARVNRDHGIWGGENDEERAAAGFAPRSPSRRSVIAARDGAPQVPDPQHDADRQPDIEIRRLDLSAHVA